MDNKGEIGVRKGAWTKEEDILLTKCIQQFGEGRWHLVPPRAGLNRCRKSCRMRWLNYLQPSLKRGSFGEDEVDLIKRMHKLLGNRWSLIAKRIPGRTSNDVKNFWNSHICKKLPSNKMVKEIIANKVIKPQPRRLTMSRLEFLNSPNIHDQVNGKNKINEDEDEDEDEDEGVNNGLHLNQEKKMCSSSSSSPLMVQEEKDESIDQWWKNLLQMSENGEDIIIPECLI